MEDTQEADVEGNIAVDEASSGDLAESTVARDVDVSTTTNSKGNGLSVDGAFGGSSAPVACNSQWTTARPFAPAPWAAAQQRGASPQPIT